MIQSLSFREEGNSILKSITTLKLIGDQRENALQKALINYYLAVDHAKTHDDLASAYKNLTIVTYESFLINTEKEQEKGKSWLTKCISYCKDCLVYGTYALHYGQDIKDKEWLLSIREKTSIAVVKFYEYTTTLPTNDFMTTKFALNELKANCSLANNILCLINFYTSNFFLMSQMFDVFDDEKSLIKKQNLINESSFHYEESLRYFTRLEFKKIELPGNFIKSKDLNMLKESIDSQIFALDSFKTKRKADVLLDKILNDKSVTIDELAWDTVDLYRSAIEKTREKNFDLEAESLSKIGLLYDKAMNLKTRARHCFYTCIKLCETLKPKSFAQNSWYKRCLSRLKDFQDEFVKQEELLKEAEKKKCMKEIEGDLKKISKNAIIMEPKEFLDFVYENYPPKIMKNKTREKILTENDLLKAIKTALIHYHPDKNTAQEYGNAWHFTADKISKEIGRLFEKYKSMDQK
jgi:hypothetical protein